jgi:hypothetical protein
LPENESVVIQLSMYPTRETTVLTCAKENEGPAVLQP